ncbi:sialin-like [Crassostrea virginica]
MANSPDESDSPVPSDTAVLNSSSTDPPKDDEEDLEDFKIRRTPSMISDRESLVNSDRKGSMSSPEHGGSRYIRRQESTQSSRSRVLSRRSVKSHSFSQSPESDNLRRSFRRLRSGSLNYMHHDSIVSSFLEQLQMEPPVDPHKVPWWTSCRVRFSGLCFLGFFFLYAQRVNLSIAIVCMVRTELAPPLITNFNSNTTNLPLVTSIPENVTSAYPQGIPNQTVVEGNPRSLAGKCPIPPNLQAIKGEFTWDKELQGGILGAFFWGYTVMQIPSGVLSERFGPRIIIFGGMFLVSVLTILTPVLARGSPYLLIITRVLIGMGEAAMYPGAQVFWSKWSPPHERSRLVAFAFGGSQLGNALAFPISSFLCEYVGWPAIFYVLGSCSLLWSLCWGIFARDNPSAMKSITEIERKYIEHSLGKGKVPDHKIHKKKSKPWKSILTSRPVWAILVANAAGNYGAYMLLTQMPTYLKEVLKFDIKSNGVYSMIPYLGFWMMISLAGMLADFLIEKEILSIKWTRKVFCLIGHFVPAAFLIGLGYMTCSQQVGAIALLTLSLAFCGFQFPAVFVNHGDIAPNYAGTIFGITNTGASIPGIIAPYVVASITVDKTPKGWQVAFYIAAVIYVLGAIFFLIFSDGEVQEWAKDEEDMEMLEADKTANKLPELEEAPEEDNVFQNDVK